MNSFNAGRTLTPALTVLCIAGCAVTPPSSPTLTAVPSPGKSLNQFQQEDYSCRNYAAQIVAGAVTSSKSASAGFAAPVLGAAGGAAGGALIGSGSGNAGAGAAIGAGVGLLAGSVAGSEQHRKTEAALQQQFNNAYAQCITEKGNIIVPPPVTLLAPAPPVIYYAPRPYYYVPY